MTTLTSVPTEPSAFYDLMGADALMAHIEAAVGQLARIGVEITPDARRGIDELAESVIEYHARTNPSLLSAHLARLQREASSEAVQ